jgi:fumarate reductase subunit D
MFVLLLVHSAHRFRYTLYHGLRVKQKRTVAVLCYGTAIVGSVATLAVLWVAAQRS